MTLYFSDEEKLDRDGLIALQRRKLKAMLREVLASNSFYQKKFAGITFDAETDSLDQLPFTTRAEIEEDQQKRPPYGTNLTYPFDQYVRHHQTSGSRGSPVHWLDTPQSWDWWKHCWSVVYRAAGVTQSDRIMFPFSFGPFIGFWAAYESASALGNRCLPAGGMTTTARLNYLREQQATVICCTPTYALRMVEVARDEGIDLSACDVKAIIVAGEPGGNIPSTKSRIESGWGAGVFDHPGMTEMGAWGFTCEQAPGGVHVIESEFMAEVIDPQTCKVVEDGVAGELVLTNLGRWGSPLIRYRTGDQVSLSRSLCSCGRSFARAIGGVLGRIDDMIVVRGNNVFPSSIESVLREIDGVAEFQMEVSQSGSMSELLIRIEPVDSRVEAGLADRVQLLMQDRLHFKPRVVLVEKNSLPRFEMKANRLIHPDRDSNE